jgi:hypothetical protein
MSGAKKRHPLGDKREVHQHGIGQRDFDVTREDAGEVSPF